MTVCYLTCVWIEMKQEGQFSTKKTQIYYSMLFNLYAYWNETRGVVFKKIQLMTICCWTRERKETRRAVFKKQQCITVCYSTCVRIEMKQEGQFSTKKTQIYYSMLFNLCAYWNETRGVVFKKIQLMTICSWTRERIEMKQEGQFSKKIQLMTICYWTRVRNETRGAVFKKTTIYYCMLFNLFAYWNETRWTVFKKNNYLLQYVIQLMCILKWNKRGSFQKTSNMMTICHWTHVRIEMKQEGQCLQKNTQFITVCYSTSLRIEMKQEGQFSKKS